MEENPALEEKQTDTPISQETVESKTSQADIQPTPQLEFPAAPKKKNVRKFRFLAGVLILLIIIVFSVVIYFYFKTKSIELPKENGGEASEEISDKKAFSIEMNKNVYGYGEPVEITINRGDYPREDQSYLSINGCSIEFERLESDRITEGGREAGMYRRFELCRFGKLTINPRCSANT